MRHDRLARLKPIEDVYDAVTRERARQDYLWGVRERSDQDLLAVLMEEVGEIAKCLNEQQNPAEELVHVAAVCVKWLQLQHQ